MAEQSIFRGILVFFDKIGIYDVVLPFLLVFTIVYAILEKTKVLGTVKVGDQTYTQKNLNAMAAFVVSFLVVASSHLVEIITKVSSQMVVLLLGSVFFLVLVGSFYKEGEGVFLEKGWKSLFMVIMFIGLVMIFLHAIPTSTGKPWLEWFLEYLARHWSSTAVGSIILILFIIIFIYWVTGSPQGSGGGPKKEEKKE